MVITIAVIFYKLIKRFPAIVLVIYTTECCAVISSIETEKEAIEEVDFLLDSTISQESKVVQLDNTANGVFNGKVIVNQQFPPKPFSTASFNKLYILYCRFLIDRR